MSPNETIGTEPRLSPDFAAQVLRRVDSIRSRRKLVRRAGAVVAIAGFVAAALALRMIDVQPVDPIPRPDFPSVETASLQTPAQSAKSQTLDYMFPDAMPLARFSNSYAGATDGNSTDALFAQDVRNDDSL